MTALEAASGAASGIDENTNAGFCALCGRMCQPRSNRRGGEDRLVTQEYGEDNYGRMVIDLSANGSDVGSAGLRAGVLRSWDHKGTRALEPRPRWCEGAGS